jgi:excisionase family DNA binding protein
MSTNMLTVAQVAADLNVTPDAVRKWIASNQLKSTKFGTQHAISEQDFATFKLSHSSKRGRKPKESAK